MVKKRMEINRVLVMDDEESVREVVREMLKYLGYEVATTSGGSEALRLYRNSFETGQSFDLVITDLTVPGDFGGVELLKKLQEVDPEAKVIISSGYFTDPVMAKYKSHGFLDVIVKPYTVHDLDSKLNQLQNAGHPSGYSSIRAV
jgi:two-component system cell cycle sensor histidine kinase/response regulator CckA